MGRLKGATILIKGSKIWKVGRNIDIPENARRIDAAGLRVYPGLVAARAQNIGVVGFGGGGKIADRYDPFSLDVLGTLAAGITTVSQSDAVMKILTQGIDDLTLRENAIMRLQFGSGQQRLGAARAARAGAGVCFGFARVRSQESGGGQGCQGSVEGRRRHESGSFASARGAGALRGRPRRGHAPDPGAPRRLSLRLRLQRLPRGVGDCQRYFAPRRAMHPLAAAAPTARRAARGAHRLFARGGGDPQESRGRVRLLSAAGLRRRRHHFVGRHRGARLANIGARRRMGDPRRLSTSRRRSRRSRSPPRGSLVSTIGSARSSPAKTPT